MAVPVELARSACLPDVSPQADDAAMLASANANKTVFGGFMAL
jgi:hypothetical protein